ncbi:MAG: Uma2 family endonuclease [Chitinophagaceae bacterium]|nr:Uma2 family endonuclease [Chitinophagaceae bacterium]
MERTIAKELNVRELYMLFPESVPIQVIENRFYMSPAPKRIHQKVSLKIASQLLEYAEKNNLGEVYEAPFDVFLNDKNIYQPDIIFISSANLQHLTDTGFEGAPDLIVEILSESNKKDDLETKKKVYEACGVKEYFIVNPETKAVLHYLLKDGKFSEASLSEAVLQSQILKHSVEF